MNEQFWLESVMKVGALILVAWAWFQVPKVAEKFSAAIKEQAAEFRLALTEQRTEFRAELTEFRAELRAFRDSLDRQADLVESITKKQRAQ